MPLDPQLGTVQDLLVQAAPPPLSQGTPAPRRVHLEELLG